MKKEDYKNLLENKPWLFMSDHFDKLEKHIPSKITTCNIKSEDWIKFSIDYFDQAHQNYEMPKPHYSDFGKKLASTNIKLGRNKHNSFELNYGVEGDTNKKMIEMFGDDNITKLNLRSDYLFFRLLVKLPGHGVAWHVDDIGTYTAKFKNDFVIDKVTKRCPLGQIVRYWFPVTDWHNGFMFQISETVLWNWKAGDVYNIPFGVGHCSANAGYVPQFTVSLTGILND